jgi:hypothetical protein
MALKDAQHLTFSNMISHNLFVALACIPIPGGTVRIIMVTPPALITPATAVIMPMVWVTVIVFRRALAPVPIPVMAAMVIIIARPFITLATFFFPVACVADVVWNALFWGGTLYVIAL